jgi:hypothetical protein
MASRLVLSFHLPLNPGRENLGDLVAVLVHHHHVIVPRDADIRQMEAGGAAAQRVQRINEWLAVRGRIREITGHVQERDLLV